MKKALLIVCAVVCSVFYVAAQQYQDVVYLKNGSVVRGIILEQIPGKTIKIATDNGSHFIFSLTEVEKMTKELPIQPQSQQHVYQSQPQQPQYQQPIQSQPVAIAPVRAPKVKKVIDWTPRYKGQFRVHCPGHGPGQNAAEEGLSGHYADRRRSRHRRHGL